jgi:hypothetical protein
VASFGAEATLAISQCRPPLVTTVGIGPDYFETPVIAEPKKRFRVFEYRGQPSFSVFSDRHLELVHQRGDSAPEAREARIDRNTGPANSPFNVGSRYPYRDASRFRHDRYAGLVQLQAYSSRSLGQIDGTKLRSFSDNFSIYPTSYLRKERVELESLIGEFRYVISHCDFLLDRTMKHDCFSDHLQDAV